ncbi:MAG: peptidase dimerization domain-containing protein [Lentisphaeria bacterium]
MDSSKMTFDDILKSLPHLTEECRKTRQTLLTNLVMTGEIPAPTFAEDDRIEFLQRRIAECQLENCSRDAAGNVVGILRGEDEQRNILVLAHTDTVIPETTDHTISLAADTISGAGVADNSLGLAFLTTLPTFMDRLGIKLKSNIIIMATSRSLGRGNLEGLRFFLDNNRMPINAGLCVEGVQLGRLSMTSLGMLRGEISCTVSEEYDWSRFGTVNAILTLNEVINHVLEIPVPQRPRTSIVLGTISGGQSFNTIAKHAVLGFEIRSESDKEVSRIADEMHNITSEISLKTGSDVHLDIFAKRKAGGINFNHPLARSTRDIIQALDIPLRVAPSTSELAALIDHGIPAITTGITTAENINTERETVYIEPMFKGCAQLLALILAIDGGFCDYDN